MGAQQARPQPIGVGVLRVGNPTAEGGPQAFGRELAGAIGALLTAQAAHKQPHVAPPQAAMVTEQPIADKLDALVRVVEPRFQRVERQTQGGGTRMERRERRVQGWLRVGENQEVVAVAHMGQPQFALEQRVEAVEVDIRPELARQGALLISVPRQQLLLLPPHAGCLRLC